MPANLGPTGDSIVPPPLQAALATAIWCVLHSVFVTHRWDRVVARHLPSYRPWQRLAYVGASAATFGLLALWLRVLPETTLWEWNGVWRWARWLGLAEAGMLFWLGARAFDGRTFLGLRQAADHVAGRPERPAALREEGILGVIRHPWYAGTLILLAFSLPITDVNLAWRTVLAAYVLIGTELEERKLLVEFGAPYADYRRRVPRYMPRLRRGAGPPA
jgi:protein-S-isoprenylcysteine O-methyltransferase Ste14